MSLYTSDSIELTIAPQCPWHEAQVQYGTPNVDWCEPTVCSYISEPANTWSNIGFILVGVLILKKWSTSLIRQFGVIVITMGTFSAIYHATNNYLSQYLDFIGMSLMTSFLLAFSLLRLRSKSFESFFALYWFFVSLNMMLIMALDITKHPIQMLLLVNALPIIVMELISGYRDRNLKSYGFFFAGFLTLILAQVSAQIDLKRIYCQPENLVLHGHVIWHLLCAIAMYLVAKHMSRMLSRPV